MNSRFKINEYVIDLNNYIDISSMVLHDHLEQEIEKKMYEAMEYIVHNDVIVCHSYTYYVAFFTSPWKRYFAIYFLGRNDELILYDMQSCNIV